MDVQVLFLAKATVWIRARTYEDDGVTLVDPTGVTVTLHDADGTAILTDTAMSNAAGTGLWDYYYTLASDAPEGWWNGEVWSTDGAGGSAKKSFERFSFEVKLGLQ